MNYISIWHRHYWGKGYLAVLNTSGEYEFLPNMVCLDQRCKLHKVWFSGKWWETFEFKWPKNVYVHARYI